MPARALLLLLLGLGVAAFPSRKEDLQESTKREILDLLKRLGSPEYDLVKNMEVKELMELLEEPERPEWEERPVDRKIEKKATKSTKKGVAMATKDYMCEDFAVLDVAWYYDWRLILGILKAHTIDCPAIPTVQYVPMAFKFTPTDYLGYATHVTQDYNLLLYNEPPRYKQANMTPEDAATAWMAQKAQVGPMTKIITPALSSCKEANDKCMMSDYDWFDRFFAACTGCRFDAMAVHHYTCEPQWTLNYLRKLHDKYQLPLWLTEFACLKDDLEKVKNYMQGVVTALETPEYDYVERYAWFRARIRGGHGHLATLLKPDSSELTELGLLYNSF